jgi:23S rRNA (guanosine2251-2'-O)-methyltransferase
VAASDDAGEPGPDLLFGVHPVTELLEQRPHDVERVFIVRGRQAKLGRLLRAARERGVPVSHLSREVLARKVGRRAVHQGVAARVTPLAYAPVDRLVAAAQKDPRGTLVLVDRVTDPRNLGAILRTAAGAGVTGVLLSGEGTVGLNSTVVKTSAGTVERLPVAREPKGARRIRELRERGFVAVALDPRGAPLWDGEPLRGRIIIVAGGEQAGPSSSVLRACDRRVSVPLSRGVESLNVAVALGVLLFEAVRQRRSEPR